MGSQIWEIHNLMPSWTLGSERERGAANAPEV